MFAKFIARLFAPLFTSPEFVASVANAVGKGAPLPPLAALVAQSIDIERLGKCLPVQMLADYIVESSVLDYDEIADRAAKLIQPADVASHVDLDDIAERAAENIDLDEIAEKAAENIDVSSVAENVEKGRDFVKAVAEEISLSDLAGELDYATLTREIYFDWAQIAGHLDNEAIAAEVQLDYSEVAGEINMCDLANELDMSSLVEEIDLDEIATKIDYAQLAEALLDQFENARERASKVEVRPSAS